jgi:hypothetical protein
MTGCVQDYETEKRPGPNKRTVQQLANDYMIEGNTGTDEINRGSIMQLNKMGTEG